MEGSQRLERRGRPGPQRTRPAGAARLVGGIDAGSHDDHHAVVAHQRLRSVVGGNDPGGRQLRRRRCRPGEALQPYQAGEQGGRHTHVRQPVEGPAAQLDSCFELAALAPIGDELAHLRVAGGHELRSARPIHAYRHRHQGVEDTPAPAVLCHGASGNEQPADS